MDTAQWPQDIIVKPMEEIVPSTCSSKAASSASSLERKARPQKEQALNCPRCNSTNTKFCYYNNYSLTQPRYFCKTCRRYWTEGGSLRNIPVGGGSRKNKRSGGIHNPSSSTPTSSISLKKNLDTVINNPSSSLQNPKIHDHHGQDLNLGFSSATTQDFKTISELIQVPNFDNEKDDDENSNNNHSSHLSALGFISGISPRGLNSFFPMPITTDPSAHVYSSGFHPLPDFKPSLSFSLDGLGSYGSLHGVQDTAGGRLLFPFEDLKQVSGNTPADHTEQDRDQNADPNGYWNGVIGGGSW